MWKIFYKTNKDLKESIEIIDTWKNFVFSKMDIKVKKYFAEKIVVLFDNKMIFNAKNGLHENLIESLVQVEENISSYGLIFKQIKAYMIFDEDSVFLVTKNLPDDQDFWPTKKNGFGFELHADNVHLVLDKIEDLEFNSLSMMVFDVALSDFYKGWINFTPEMKKRTELQTNYILMMMNAKNNEEISLVNQIEYEKNLKEQTKYQELYNKILKLMPKIETHLENEWRTSLTSGVVDKRRKLIAQK